MATAGILDLPLLTAPVPGDSEVGSDMREDASPTSLYYTVKALRSRARAAERHLMMNGDDGADPPEWKPVLKQAPELLIKQSKDLEIVVYLIEALTRLHGFRGLRDGFELARQLIENYGDELFPLPDEDGIATRLAPLTGLNGEDAEGTLIRPIACIPLTDGNEGQYSAADYEQAVDMQRSDSAVRQRRMDLGAVSMEMFQQSVAETPAPFFAELHNEMVECQEAFTALTATLDEKYGDDSPPSSAIRNQLDTCLRHLRSFAKDKLPSEEAEATGEENETEASDENVSPVAAAPARKAELETREDAFRALHRVADFFRRTEPHSPLPYALDRVVRWGRTPLPELMKELIRDDSGVQHMFHLTGIDDGSAGE